MEQNTLKTVGKAVRKKDSMQLLLGKPVYTNDLAPKDALVVKLLRSAHPNSVNMAWNFDLESGEFFGPELLGGTELQTAVAEELKRQSAERAKEFGAAPEEVYWADYEAILDDWQSSAVSFGPQGMTVAYSPYELAAYAFGAQVYEISYEFLRPYLSLQGLELLGLAEEPGA